MLPRTSQGRSYPPERPSGQPGESGPRPDTAEIDPPSWTDLARAWSPRQTIRLDPTKKHSYALECAIDDIPVDIPYALYLADEAGQYRLLAFDFDAHHDGSTAHSDAADLSARLQEADIEHVVCSSGPGGGVHLWIRLAYAVPARQVTQVATTLAATYTSMDVGALTNPATGCVRPPGAPHRSGGISQPLGAVDVGDVHFDRVAAVIKYLQPTARSTTPAPASCVEVRTDADGATYLEGPRRPLAPKIRGLAQQPLSPTTDASAVAYSILLGCAHARMRLSDVHQLAFTQRAPGLEHIRTSSSGRDRQARVGSERHLARQWARAVVAASALRPAAADPGSTRRHEAEQRVASLLAAMRAVPQRWTGRTGSQDRLVLHALAAQLLRVCRTQVHYAERSWALDAGLTRVVVHNRVARLSSEGWIQRVARGVGPWAARWSIGQGGGETRSGHLFPVRDERLLHQGLRIARHDVWQAKNLGVLGLRVWEELRSRWRPVAEIAARLGVTVKTVRQKLSALQAVSLVTGDGRAYGDKRRLHKAAEIAGTTGAHVDRERLYKLESAAFTWWFACRYAPDADATAEWGQYPSPAQAAEVHPRDIALAYGAWCRGVPPEPTTWGAAIVTLEDHRHQDPDSWWELVVATRAALPPEEVLAPAHRWVPVAA